MWHPPEPRNSIASPELSRPDWLSQEDRKKGLLWLDKNENLDPALQRIIQQVLREVDPLFLRTYPEPGSFYRKLAHLEGVKPQNLILSAGSDGAIRSVFEAYVSPGDWVIHTQPTFAMYSVYSNMYGARAIALPYEPSKQGPTLSLEKMIQAVRKTKPKAVFLPNPDSPTGTVFGREELKGIIRCALESASVILIDEAYYPFYPHSAAEWIEEFPNLIVARTFAKAWGLAGLRIGYAIANSKAIEYLNKVRPMYECNTFAIAMMERMLDHHSEVLASVKRLEEGKQHFLSRMQALDLRTLSGQGNFLHVTFGKHYDAVTKALENKVLYRKNFSEPCLQGFSRFSSTTKEIFEPVVREIERVIGGN